MGSIKDEIRGLREDHQPHQKADNGEHPGGSGGISGPEGLQINTQQESTTQEECEPQVHMNVSHTEEGNNSISKDPVFLGADCDPPDSGMAERENISVPVPLTPDSSDPYSPAPFGQQHMHTQMSLEVVQCRSAATSPMTPPEGSHSFFFPSSFGRAMGTDTKDAELQVGEQVEFCNVATSPMTPKTPSTTAIPELMGKEMVQNGGKEKNREDQRENGQLESSPATQTPTDDESVTTGAKKCTTSKQLSEGFISNASPESSTSCPSPGPMDSQATLQDPNQGCKQLRMGSLDQDITILVTHYGNGEEGEEEKAELPPYSIEPGMVKIDEFEEHGEDQSDVKEGISTETAAPDQAQDKSNTNLPQNKIEESSVPASDQSKTEIQLESQEVEEIKNACEEKKDVSVIKAVPESPAPFGCHNIRTQVSLEVVQCQSAATSPMTPPEGDQAFHFPSSFGKCVAVAAETKDAGLQVGQQVEFRSVATAPMTPRTPTTMAFPEIRKEASAEEKIVEEEEGDKAEPVQEVSWDEKGMTWEVYGAVVEVAVLGSAIQKHLEKQVKKQKRQPSMPPPPPLNPSAMPLTSETTKGGLGSGKVRAGKKGEQDVKVSRRRRNPFRLLMENVQQPHCCSRAHTTE
uniref:G protein-regulated inducer of neurite outgrowth C-terminal domain-containing protein n=1 Tax=Echeneis naucrates TaxID=173247 RepID=A0A665W9L8_ECHNA